MLFLCGCSAQQWQSVATSVKTSVTTRLAAYTSGSHSAAKSKLMIFGGPNNSVYLGCYSCPEYETDSIFNQHGDYGSKYSNASIFNSYADYGSKYSDYSACNSYANNPPVIVDGKDDFYGYLTLNTYHPKATTNDTILAWLAEICEEN